MRRKPRWLPRRELVRSLPRTGVDGCARARVANEPGARRAETRPTPTPARERRRRNVCSRMSRVGCCVGCSRVGALGVASGGAFLPTVYAYVQPTAPWMKITESVDSRPPLVDARHSSTREARDARAATRSKTSSSRARAVRRSST